MIKIVSFDPSDMELRKKVDKFVAATGGDQGIVVGLDRIVVGIDGDEVVGLFCSRQVEFCHEFRIADKANKRFVAEGLWNYGMGAAAAAGLNNGLSLVKKDNEAHIKFLHAAGAEVEAIDDSVMFIFKVR